MPNVRSDLTGWMLVSTPSIKDPAFRRSVILVVGHSAAGALGVLVNRPATNMTLRRLFVEKGLDPSDVPIGVQIYAGGPSDIETVIVVHRAGGAAADEALEVTSGIRLTSRLSQLPAIARSRLPASYMVAMGHCAWGPGQLEAELGQGNWLLSPAREELVFERSVEDRWDAAMNVMRVPPAHLSAVAGHA
jgi:putative transcriptional regulator